MAGTGKLAIKEHAASLGIRLALARQPHHQFARLIVGEGLRANQQMPRVEAQRAGFRVTLIDRGEVGEGASFGNGAIIGDEAVAAIVISPPTGDAGMANVLSAF